MTMISLPGNEPQSHQASIHRRLNAIFKAYDIRGQVPDELDSDLAYAIGIAYAQHITPKNVVIGHDARLSSRELSDALSQGLMDAGVVVHDIGLCGTEEVYFATFSQAMDGGIMVTASHNPADFNGMKLVRGDAKPISGDSGLKTIQYYIETGYKRYKNKNGMVHKLNVRQDYIKHLLNYIDTSALRPLRIVTNAGNGCAGPVLDALAAKLPFEFIKLQHDADGNFPLGVPNPLIPENRNSTSDAVRVHRADLGIAWDGDFDRCFLFDEEGQFVEGYYLVGLLASALLAKYPGGKIIHDPRLTWNTIETVKQANGIPIQNKTGHAFMKERMRVEDAIYGGEMSAHHYFRGFHYCDSGMIPWLLVTEIMSRTGKQLSELIASQQHAFPVSGEINRVVHDPDHVITEIERQYKSLSKLTDYTDGLSVESDYWRFNLRKSNTEPVLRLNVEARRDATLMRIMTDKLLASIDMINNSDVK
jgi:phosphomannomutase